MPLASSKIQCSIEWDLQKTNTGFAVTKEASSLVQSLSLAIATATQVFAAQYTIAASGTQTIDLRSFTNMAGESVTATRIYGLLITVSGTNAKVKLEPGAANPLNPFFNGTTAPYIEVSTKGHILLSSEVYTVIDATHRNILLTNTGSGSGTITVAAILGTT